MDVRINALNMTVGDRLHDYVQKKTGKLSRLLPDTAEAEVELRANPNARSAEDRQVVQMTIRNRGTILRAEERSADIFASVDMVVEKIHRQIERYRGKRLDRRRSGGGEGHLIEDADQYDDDMYDDEAPGPRVARTKRFPMMPMAIEEAIEQMELLGHDFYVFFNAEEEALNVLYRRRDGDYGLLQPEMN